MILNLLKDMGTLYIDRKDIHIKLDSNSLAFYANGEREGTVPINPLKRVVIVGNMLIEASVLRRLSEEGISVLFLSGRRLRFCGILHGRLHNNGILRVKQYEKSLSPFALEMAINIVKRKASMQRDFLMEAGEARPDLRATLLRAVCSLQGIYLNIEEKDITIERLRGLEGGASSVYFSAYTTMFPESLGFTQRTKRPPRDPANAILSLCYTLLHFEMVREIETIGLDPTIGFYHQFEYGRESLACDLVEPYRPMVDRFVWELFRDRIFTVRNFSIDDERGSCYLVKEGRKKFYTLYEEWAQKMRPIWTEEVRNLARRIMDGEGTIY
jgi:CRISPR-associated protein Cas1